MSKIRSKNTSPEKIVRKAFKELGFAYTLSPKLLGRPDLKLKGQKTLVFIDGCFWHGCNKHFVMPKSNTQFWEEKISNTRTRDTKKRNLLKTKGYKVIAFWEHDTEDFNELKNKILKKLSTKKIYLD